jgi:thiol-disulfide isomerase/thioredoxin
MAEGGNADSGDKPRGTRRGLLTGLAGAGVLGAAAVLYSTKRSGGNAAPGDAGIQQESNSVFVKAAAPVATPDVTFETADGAAVTLQSFKGRVVLLNLWATWCIPCRKELPSLDRLQTIQGSPDFEVVALAIDRSGVAGVRKYFDQLGVTSLKTYVDPTAKLASTFKVIGLPTTLLLDRQGFEVGRLIGPAAWDEGETLGLVRAQVAQK